MEIPFLAIDFKKDYRHLLRRTRDVLIFDWRNLQFNPLRPPPGVEPTKWLLIVSDIFCQVFFPSTASASKNLLLSLLDCLYREHGVYQGRDSFPTIRELDARLDPANLKEKVPSQSLQQMCTCRNKTRPMAELLGFMLNGDPGFPLEQLLEKNVVFEFDGLTGEYQEFLVNMILHWVFSYRIDNGHRGGLRHVLVFDEAKMVYAQNRAAPTAYITRLTSMARELGEGLIVADQMPSSLGEAIKANVFATVALNLSSMKDIQATAYAMGLNEEQRQYLMSLPVGTAIVRFADRYTRPFLLTIPRARILKNVSDAEVEDHMRPLLARMNGRQPEEGPVDVASRSGRKHPPQESDTFLPASFPDDELSTDALQLLVDIRDHPFVAAAARHKALGFSARRATRAARELLIRGCADPVRLVTGGPGRPGKYFELTAEGEGKVGRQNLGPGKGGFEHRFYQQRIRDYYEGLGHRAKIEAYVNGKAADVGVWKTREKVAIEVAMSPTHERENIEKDLRAGWDCVVVAYVDDKVRNAVRKALDNSSLMGHVEFVPVHKLVQ